MSSIDNEIIRTCNEIQDTLVQIRYARADGDENLLKELIIMYNTLFSYKRELVKKRMDAMDAIEK